MGLAPALPLVECCPSSVACTQTRAGWAAHPQLLHFCGRHLLVLLGISILDDLRHGMSRVAVSNNAGWVAPNTPHNQASSESNLVQILEVGEIFEHDYGVLEGAL